MSFGYRRKFTNSIRLPLPFQTNAFNINWGAFTKLYGFELQLLSNYFRKRRPTLVHASSVGSSTQYCFLLSRWRNRPRRSCTSFTISWIMQVFSIWLCACTYSALCDSTILVRDMFPGWLWYCLPLPNKTSFESGIAIPNGLSSFLLEQALSASSLTVDGWCIASGFAFSRCLSCWRYSRWRVREKSPLASIGRISREIPNPWREYWTSSWVPTYQNVEIYVRTWLWESTTRQHDGRQSEFCRWHNTWINLTGSLYCTLKATRTDIQNTHIEKNLLTIMATKSLSRLWS